MRRAVRHANNAEAMKYHCRGSGDASRNGNSDGRFERSNMMIKACIAKRVVNK